MLELPLAGYGRVSGYLQSQGFGPAAQRRAFDDYCKYLDVDGVWYEDLARSGRSTAGRDDWRRLMADVNDRSVRGVWMVDASRATRDELGIDWRNMLSTLQEAARELHVGHRQYDLADEDDLFTLGIMDLISGREWHSIRRRTWSAFQEAAKARPIWRGIPPIGYELVEIDRKGTRFYTRIAKVPEDHYEAALVRELWSLLRTAASLGSVAAALNEAGLRRPYRQRPGERMDKTREWTDGDVGAVIRQPLYKGLFLPVGQRGATVSNYQPKGKVGRWLTGLEPQYLPELEYVSAADWQNIYDRFYGPNARGPRSRRSSNRGGVYPLSGLVECPALRVAPGRAHQGVLGLQRQPATAALPRHPHRGSSVGTTGSRRTRTAASTAGERGRGHAGASPERRCWAAGDGGRARRPAAATGGRGAQGGARRDRRRGVADAYPGVAGPPRHARAGDHRAAAQSGSDEHGARAVRGAAGGRARGAAPAACASSAGAALPALCPAGADRDELAGKQSAAVLGGGADAGAGAGDHRRHSQRSICMMSAWTNTLADTLKFDLDLEDFGMRQNYF